MWSKEIKLNGTRKDVDPPKYQKIWINDYEKKHDKLQSAGKAQLFEKNVSEEKVGTGWIGYWKYNMKICRFAILFFFFSISREQ